MLSNRKSNLSADTMADSYESLLFIIDSVVNKINTAEIVRVISKNGDGTINVINAIEEVDSENNRIPTAPIYNIKYIQWQFGENAIKAEPEVGDVGLIIICSKDTSNVEEGVIGSYRRYNLADGIYIGGLFGFNEEPTQYISFSDDGIEIKSDKTINVNGKTVNVTAESVNLGGEGGAGVARIGDAVAGGVIVGGSSIVKSV